MAAGAGELEFNTGLINVGLITDSSQRRIHSLDNVTAPLFQAARILKLWFMHGLGT